ncbi:hypothetical protein BH10BDE1_BH10BDE1_09620 [soil metagenome]
MHRYLFLFLLIPLAAIAASNDWDQRYDELCKNDKWCVRLKTQDGAWMKPKPEILAVMRTKEVQTEIHAAAAKYGVEASAIAGAIIAENSMNVTKTDTAQTWLAKNMGITSIGKKKFSFGMGQINIDAAMEAERHVASVEKRTPRSEDEMVQEIADPLGSVRVAASIIRKVQDDYKKEGFDISKDVGVLTTLYNLGGSEQRAKDTKKAGTQPKMNYFGTFVSKYLTEVKSAVGTAPKAAPLPPFTLATTIAVPPADDSKDPIQLKGSDKLEKVSRKKKPASEVAASSQPAPASVPMVQTETVSTSIPLIGAPLLCATSDEDRYDESKTKTGSHGAPTGILEKGHSFRELSRALDCNSITWKLVEADNGSSGWVKESMLDSIRKKKVERVKSCDAELKAATTCAAAVTSALGDKAVTSDARTMVFANPVGPKVRDGDSKVVSFKREDFQCRDRDKKREDPQNFQSQQRRQMSLADVSKEIGKYKAQQQQSSQRIPTLNNGGLISANMNGQTVFMNAYTGQVVPTGANGQPVLPAPTTPVPDAPALPVKEVAAANISYLDQQANTLAKTMKLSQQDLLSPSNPYANVATWLAQHRTYAASCLVKASSESGGACKIQPISDAIKAAFEKMKYERVPDIEQTSAAMQSISMAEMENYLGQRNGMRNLDDLDSTPFMNYLPGEPELANRSVQDIRESIASCEAGLAKLKASAPMQVPVIASGLPQGQSSPYGGNISMGGMGSNGMGMYGGGAYGRSTGGQYGTPFGIVGGYGLYEADSTPFFLAAKEATDDQIKENAAEFISLGKFCHSRLNLLSDSPPSGEGIQCTQAPEYLTLADGQFARAIVAKTYTKNPQALIDAVNESIPLFLKPDTVKSILGEDKFKPRPQTARASRRQMDEESEDPRGPANYCPNRTAEKIEDLLKDNPCIKRVYVPTRYLSNKLGPNDPRVVYRQFEQEDRYAVEVGSVTCEK